MTLEGEQACLDRDIVLRWRVAAAHPGLALRRARPGAGRPHAGHAYGLLTIVPPSAAEESLPRDLILLIDTSGSMSGFPLESAKKVVGALVESLSEQDRLEMISFALEPQRWKLEPVAAGEQARREARLWLEGLQAGGGTEMASGLREALRPLRPEAQRQVVLVTDGLIGFESEVVAMLRDRLPRGARLHVVGIGAAVNRSLTGPAARAGRGAEVIIGPDEPAGRAAERIVAATRRPILVNLIVEGDAVAGHVPKSLPDVMSGSPCLAGVRLRPEGGDLIVSAQGPSGAWRESLRVPPTDPEEGSDAIVKLYGREAVEDLELDLAAGGDAGEIDRAVERLGLQFGIATRLTSWVAVSEEKSVDPSEPVRATRIPQEIPYGMSAEGLGLREASWFGGDMLIRGAFLGKIDRRSPMRVGRAKPDLVGSWLSPREDGLIVLEVTIVEGTISWKPQGLVRLLKMDGPPDRHGGLTSTEAAIEPGLSTREGVLTMGQLFRVALRADRAVVEQVFLVVLDLEGESLRVRVK